MSEKAKEFAKPLAFVVIVAALLALNAAFGWSSALESALGANSLRELVAAHPLRAAVTYVAITVVGCVALFMPGVVFAIVAGLVFGPVAGTILCLVAATIGSSLSFLVGRYFLKDSLKPRIARNKQLNRLLFDGAQRNAVFVLAVTRLVPIFPFNLQNFAYGISDMRFWPYTFWSFVFMIPGTALYTVAAAGFVAEGQVGAYVAIVAVLAVLVAVLAAVLRKRMPAEVGEDDERQQAAADDVSEVEEADDWEQVLEDGR